MKNTLRIFVILIAAGACAVWQIVSTSAQKRRSEFHHSTAGHKKLDCASCHKTPTANWEKARGFPDVADYPGHASCVQCHRDDFFRGNSPPICTICHTNPSPRNGARFSFPVQSRPREFTTIFPHDVHQDIIAENRYRDGVLPVHFAEAVFSGDLLLRDSAVRAKADDPPPPQFNNCAICHQTAAVLPKFGNRRPAGLQPLANTATDNYILSAGFFKDAPDGHASCFTCHYQGQKLVRNDCAGCHRPAASYVDDVRIARYSLKFDHQSPNHVNKDCTTCHVRITQTSDLAAMRGADVPFMTCASCHAAQLKDETENRAASLGGQIFQCSYCHAAEIGRYEIPASHRSR